MRIVLLLKLKIDKFSQIKDLIFFTLIILNNRYIEASFAMYVCFYLNGWTYYTKIFYFSLLSLHLDCLEEKWKQKQKYILNDP